MSDSDKLVYGEVFALVRKYGTRAVLNALIRQVESVTRLPSDAYLIRLRADLAAALARYEARYDVNGEPVPMIVLSDDMLAKCIARGIGHGFDVDTCEPQRMHLTRRVTNQIWEPICDATTLWCAAELDVSLGDRWRVIDCADCIEAAREWLF